MAAAVLVAAALLGSSCADGEPAQIDEGTTFATEPSTRGEASMSFRDSQFEPASLSVVVGARLRVTNETDSAVSIVVSGTSVDGPEARELEPGESFTLVLQAVGAQVLTLADDPDATGSVMVIDSEG